jgi:large subunit ribosomal protein L25
MENVILEAKERIDFKKSYRKQLRKNSYVPGVFYSRHEKPLAIEVTEKEINPLVFTSETHLISLKLDGKEELECIIKDIQFDPLTDKILHFDLMGLTKGEKFQLEVPLQLQGSAVGVKEGGILQQSMHKLEIECLPTDIPKHITVDISNLKLGDSIHVGDLKLENVTFLNAEDSVIVSVVHPKVEKEPVPAEEEIVEEPTEPEIVGKGKAEKPEEEKE